MYYIIYRHAVIKCTEATQCGADALFQLGTELASMVMVILDSSWLGGVVGIVVSWAWTLSCRSQPRCCGFSRIVLWTDRLQVGWGNHQWKPCWGTWPWYRCAESGTGTECAWCKTWFGKMSPMWECSLELYFLRVGADASGGPSGFFIFLWKFAVASSRLHDNSVSDRVSCIMRQHTGYESLRTPVDRVYYYVTW